MDIIIFIIFAIVCVGIGLAIHRFTDNTMDYISGDIRNIKVARVARKVYLLITIVLVILVIVLPVLAGGKSTLKPETCGWCGGDGISLSGKRCSVCDGAGGAIITSYSSEISVIYVMGLLGLALFTIISRSRLGEYIEKMESLMRYKDLLDSGTITKEEYYTKRKQLIGF